MNQENETVGQWLTRKRRTHRPKLSQQKLAARASGYVPISQTYVSLLERTAGTRDEPQVSSQRLIALAHALGENPNEVLALRANVIPGEMIPSDVEISLPSGGSVIVRGRSGQTITTAEQSQLAAVIDAMISGG